MATLLMTFLVVISLTVLLSTAGQVGGNEGCMFRPVSVSQYWLERPKVQLETFDLPPTSSASPFLMETSQYKCSLACCQNDWCHLSCTSGTTCFLASALAAPNYIETETSNVLSCYTRRKWNFAADVPIYGVPPHPTYSGRVREMAVMGVYDYSAKYCFQSKKMSFPWLLLDLGDIRIIREMFLIFNSPGSQSDYEIRIGNETVSASQFKSSYKLFSFIQKVERQMLIRRSEEPIDGRYVSIQSVSSAEMNLYLCYVEIP